MANVLILSLVFAPDGVSTAQLMKELAVDLDADGHQVHVVSTTPHYNRDPVAEASQPLRRTWGGFLYRSKVGGVTAYHTPSPRKSGGLLSRAGGWLVYHVLGTVVALIKVPRPDVIIVPSPLLTIGVMGWFITRLRGGRMIYNVQELYPDVALQMGKLHRGPLASTLFRLERFVYDRAAAVVPIGALMARGIIEKGVPASKVRTIPNFVDVADLRPLPKRNEFSVRHHLADRFVVSYAGNMGYAQGLEVLLSVAERLRGERDIVVAFIGDGVLKPELQRAAAERDLDNVVFIDHQPYSMVPEIYAASDVAVVALVDAFSSEATPSKVYRIMACQRTVLAIAAADSDLGLTVAKSNAGVVVSGKDASVIAQEIMRLRDEPARREAHGAAGRAFALEHVARSVVTARYSALVDELASA